MHASQRVLIWFAVIVPLLLAAGLAGELFALHRAALEPPRGLMLGAGLIAALVGVSLLAVFLGVWLPRARLRDVVVRLERGAEELSLDDPAQQLATTSDPLVERLVVAFDLMSHRFAGADAQLRETLRHAEQLGAEVEEREVRIRRLFDAALDAILTLDAKGQVLELNPSAEALLGIPAEHVRGEGLDACLAVKNLSEDGRAWLLPDDGPSASTQRREIDLVTKTGRRFPAEVTVIGWETSRGSFRTLFMRDITERQRVHALLERSAQRANVANEAKTRFLASMSHEIRTPLNAILNMNELLLESELDAEQHTYAVTAGESARALLSIVNSVLDFSKIEHDRVEPTTRLSDPEEIAKSAVDLLAARAHARELELTLFCDPTVPAGIVTDPGLVRQILLNLIGNAIRFTDEGTVAVRIVADRAERSLNFDVIDTGVGISKSDQSQLFSEFKQADTLDGRPGGGSGLGLAISRRLARMLGGDITLSSAPGQGSCFTLNLGFPEGLSTGERSAAAVALGGWRVALWADSALVAEAIAEQLCAYGILVEVLQAPSESLPNGCCGQLRLLSTSDQEPPREIVLYRIGSRCVSDESQHPPTPKLRLPVGPSALLTALLDAVEHNATVVKASPQNELAERVARCAATAQPLLLAEDSPANQLVATSILRKAGFQVDVVENGLQAVAAVNRSHYALVLMDLAMPDMDGIEATHCIRALPGERGRVPIVAMTANAFDEDRRRCFEAGMNGHLSKPVERRTLFEALLRWIDVPEGGVAVGSMQSDSAVGDEDEVEIASTRPTAHTPTPAPVPTADLPPLDEQVIAELTQELSAELMPEVVATFVDEAAGRVQALERAVAEGDCQAAAEEAHALKGSSATFGAQVLRTLAAQMEQAGRGGDLEALRDSVDPLRTSADLALRALRERYGLDSPTTATLG